MGFLSKRKIFNNLTQIMKKAIPFTFLFFMLIVGGYAQMDKKEFKALFDSATTLMDQEDYVRARIIWDQLIDVEPDNANIKFSIGMCMVNSPSEVERKASIEMLQEAESNMAAYYKKADYREKAAPVETIRYIGKAYHVNYQFQKALDKFLEYKSILAEGNEEDLQNINRDIEMTKNAMRMVNTPVDVDVRMAYDMNTKWPEYRPLVNADETMMIYTARRDDSKGGLLDDEGKYFEDLYVSYKIKGVWTKPLPMDDINTEGHEATIYMSPSGDQMFIYKYDDELGGSIYETFLRDGKWTKPEMLNRNINSEAWETHATMSVDKKILVFTSDREGGLGKRDLWLSKKLPNGEWAKPTNLGSSINTEYDEESPYLHPDGKTLYFSSKGHNSMGGFDVFKVTYRADSTWSKPENMGYPINTTGDDVFFLPNTNGMRAYFASFREGGKGDMDVYIMDLHTETEKNLTIYKGLAHDINGNVVKNLVITVFDQETDDIFGVYRPNPVTGKFLFILRPGHTYEIEYEVDGVIQTETITIKDDGNVKEINRLVIKEKDKITVNAAEANDLDVMQVARVEEATGLEVVEIDVKLNAAVEDSVVENKVKDNVHEEIFKTLDQGGKVVLENILFEYNSDKLTEDAEIKIDLIYQYMVKNPDVKVRITGHTDAIGSDAYNLDLSRRRARSVRNYLVSLGISKKRMTYEGKGESEPIAPNAKPNGDDDPEGRQRNRRVEFEVF